MEYASFALHYGLYVSLFAIFDGVYSGVTLIAIILATTHPCRKVILGCLLGLIPMTLGNTLLDGSQINIPLGWIHVGVPLLLCFFALLCFEDARNASKRIDVADTELGLVAKDSQKEQGNSNWLERIQAHVAAVALTLCTTCSYFSTRQLNWPNDKVDHDHGITHFVAVVELHFFLLIGFAISIWIAVIIGSTVASALDKRSRSMFNCILFLLSALLVWKINKIQ